MLVVKFEKTDGARYISHIDLLRHISRIMRRANVEMEYSRGFNPHELMFFSSPSPVGLKCLCEYVTLVTKADKKDFVERFNAASISGIRATRVWETAKNPNFASISHSAKYVLDKSLVDEKKLADAFLAEQFTINFVTKGEEKSAEVRERMLSYEIAGDKIYLVLAFGNDPLRIDRFLNSVGRHDAEKVEKVELFCKADNKVVTADEYLDGIKI